MLGCAETNSDHSTQHNQNNPGNYFLLIGWHNTMLVSDWLITQDTGSSWMWTTREPGATCARLRWSSATTLPGSPECWAPDSEMKRTRQARMMVVQVNTLSLWLVWTINADLWLVSNKQCWSLIGWQVWWVWLISGTLATWTQLCSVCPTPAHSPSISSRVPLSSPLTSNLTWAR